MCSFPVERGALACGIPPPEKDVTWATETLLTDIIAKGKVARVLAIEKSFDAANLGGMIRTARAFGVDLVYLYVYRTHNKAELLPKEKLCIIICLTRV
jgi:tRNA G18 (ribose-2'-O)-methylase SpoU